MSLDIFAIKKVRSFASDSTMLLRFSIYVLVFMAILGCAGTGVTTKADQYGPAQIAYAPPGGRGPIVVLLSGHDGPNRYEGYAEDLSKLGYYAVLLDSNDIVKEKGGDPGNLEKSIDRARRSPHGLPGKVACIGFSLGGYAVLAHAAPKPDLMSAVIAFYPATRWIRNNMKTFTANFKVPILLMSGGRDNYIDCCTIESMRDMDAAARANGAKFEFVEYPLANHVFNFYGDWYRRDDAADSWCRSVDMLRKYHPLP